MESFLNRYRNITVLLLVIFAQLVLLAVQVKNGRDVRMIRVWSVTAVAPVAQAIEAVRGGTIGFVKNYVWVREAGAENRRLRSELDRLRLDNIFLKNELNTADRAKALQVFQTQTRSKTLAATVIGTGPSATSKVVFVDRGSASGVKRGMAVVTPDGIVGKVFAAYPTASEVLLVTDPNFAAGVISQKNSVRGTVKGMGTPLCKVDYVPLEEKVEAGEWLYTSGDDRIFPRGFPVGVVKASRDAHPYREIFMEPSGLKQGLSDVLILIDAVHQELPAEPPQSQPVYVAPAPPAQAVETVSPGTGEIPPQAPPPPSNTGTEADKLRRIYKEAGDAQGHVYGEGLPGSKPPDFTKIGQPVAPATAPAAKAPATPGGTPASVPAAGSPPSVSPAPKTLAPAPLPKTTGPAAAPKTAAPRTSPAMPRVNPPAGFPAGSTPGETGGAQPR